MKFNKKNFWKPFWIYSGVSFLFLFLTLTILFNAFSNGVMNYLLWIISKRYFILFVLLILVSIPVFFIIRRLLTKKPKKVFYIELPILIIIYSFIGSINIFLGLMIGGPMGMSTLDILFLILPQIIFVIIWLVLLTISLYFYYKRIKR